MDSEILHDQNNKNSPSTKHNQPSGIINTKCEINSNGPVIILNTPMDMVRAKYSPKEKYRILLNLMVLGISFIFLFTAFLSMSTLQSSINKKNGLGSYSLSAIYLSMMISSLFIPPLIIHKLGCKWTLIISMIGYNVYIAAQFYPTFTTLIPTGIFLGICASPLWTAQSVYLTKVGEEYAILTGQTTQTILQRFFGLFYLLLYTSHIWGNLIAATLLASDDESIFLNQSETLKTCGVNYCPITNRNGTEAVELLEEKESDSTKLYTLATVFLVSSIIAVIIVILFLDSLERFGESVVNTNKAQPKLFDRLIATVKHWKRPYQLLLIPMQIWSGVEQGIVITDFTAGYVTCAWTTHNIGYIFMSYGICNSLVSLIFGSIMKYIGRPITFILAFTCQMGALLIMMYWSPNPNSPILFFVIAGLWGASDGICVPQNNALVGTIFPNNLDAAFSNNRLWTSLGYFIACFFANIFCVRIKLYISFIVIGISAIGYLLVEFDIRRMKNSTLNLEEEKCKSIRSRSLVSFTK